VQGSVQPEDPIYETFKDYLIAVGPVTNLKEATFHMIHLGQQQVQVESPSEEPNLSMIIRGAYDTTLKRRLIPFVEGPCYCPEGPELGIYGGMPPDIICVICYRKLGTIPLDVWTDLQFEIKMVQGYLEATVQITRDLFANPTWRCLMIQVADPNAEGDPGSANYPDPAIIRTILGHIIYETSAAAALGEQCAHRWIIMPNGVDSKCLLCEGVRKLDPQELQIIEAAEQAGVQFLKWPERFARLQQPKARRRRSKSKSGSKATGGVKVGTEIPEGFIPVAEAAALLSTDAKRLRKRIRNGEFEATKVSNRVYVKMEAQDEET
jgi:hypothetical protein